MHLIKSISFKLLLTISLIIVCSCKDDNEDPTPGQPTNSITLEDSNTHPVLPQDGGTITIPFTATGDWSASLMNNRAEGWITVSPTSGKAGDVLLSLTATANDTYDERNATIVLKCGTVTKNIVLTQKQKDAILLSSSKYEVPGEGGEISVEVQANVSFEVEVKEDWIKQIETRALTTSSLNFTIETNETGEPREGEIIVKSGELSETIHVFQGFDDFIVLTQKDYTLPEEGGSIDVEIRSTVDYGVKILDNVGWITEIQTRAVSTHTHHYQVAPNESYDPREAKIVFYSLEDESLADTVSVYQMYKGAILVARNEYQFGIEGGDFTLTVSSNLEFDVTVSDEWIQQIGTRGLIDTELNFTILENTERKEREGTITVKDKNSDKQQIVTVKQTATDLEREALIALYKATNGDNWTHNDNWCSDKPITEWYGIDTFNREWGRALSINLTDNNLNGFIPEEIGLISNLEYLLLGNNKLTGKIPDSICQLIHLNIIDLDHNELEGYIPSDIGLLKKLVTFNVTDNHLNGSIPQSIGKLVNLETFYIDGNQIEGNIPNSVGNLLKLRVFRAWNNNLEGNIPVGFANIPDLVWLQISGNRLSGIVPAKLVQCSNWRYWDPSIDVLPQQNGYLLRVDINDLYSSTDYSKDKEIKILQTHTRGNGIKVVIMGDLFVDIDMGVGGEYETKAKNAMEYYFSIEPFKSLRDYYDVIMIKAVSKNFMQEGDSVFSSNEFGLEDKDKCLEYAKEAIGDTKLDNIHVIMMQNIPAGLGITYLYENGFSIACCPCLYDGRVGTVPDFEGYIHHEANGHGFGFLYDQYIVERGHIPSEIISDMQEMYNKYGWYANVDFTTDPLKVKWAHFIYDPRYADEKINIYEGAYWEKGIYSPQGGVMSGTQGLFNAPSREAIYKRAMKLAYGDSWTYDYEKFVQFDIPGHNEWLDRYVLTKKNDLQVKGKMYKHNPPVIYNYPAIAK